MIAGMVVLRHEGGDLTFEIARQVIVLEQDAVLERLMPALDLALGLRVIIIRFKNGSTWQVVGSDRYDAAVGSSPAGITFSEWALSNPSAWAYLAPIVTENDGWALFITTARGRNHAKSMLDMAQTRDDWFSEVLPVNVTNAMSEEAVEQQRLEYTGIFGKEAADALIDQEYYCSFEAAILGAYWGKEMLLAEQQGRICDVPVNTDLPVHTAWDIGVDDAMAIWCFQVYPTTSTSWTITRATVRASTTIANGSTSAAITAPTGCPTTRRCARWERLERARGSRRCSRWAASPSWLQSSR